MAVGNRHQVSGNALAIFATGDVFVVGWGTTFSSQTIFGLCHNSLNSLNSEKVIWRKLDYVTYIM